MSFPVINPNWEGVPAHIHAFSTTRNGGVSLAPYDNGHGAGGNNLGDHVGDALRSVSINRNKLNAILPSDVIFLSQIHGIVAMDAKGLKANEKADAVYAAQTNLVCAVLTADCLPLLFADTDGKVVAAAHAGWRGLASGVLQNTVKKMRENGASDIVAWMGPAIGSSQFEVGQDVLDVFSGSGECMTSHFEKTSGDSKYLADIYGLARAILDREGVTQVYGGDYCTVSDSQQFYSYRRDGITGRMASVIWIGELD